MLGVRVTQGITRRGANFVSINDSLAENRRVPEYHCVNIPTRVKPEIKLTAAAVSLEAAFDTAKHIRPVFCER